MCVTEKSQAAQLRKVQHVQEERRDQAIMGM
jgi:hypothetical protein